MPKLPSSLTTITLFSKFLAGILFFTFILLGFIAGMKYQAMLDTSSYQQSNLTIIEPSPTPTDETANWKTYIDNLHGYSFKYPTDYIAYPYNTDNKIFHSPDAKYDKITTAKIKGIDIGSVVYGPGNDLKKDTQGYIGPNTVLDSELILKLILPYGYQAKAYVNLEDITVAIDYKKNNENMRLLIWCGGENGNSTGCKNILTPLLPTFKSTSSDYPIYKQVACPQDVKQCPNGGFVSRTGPNCEFSPCP